MALLSEKVFDESGMIDRNQIIDSESHFDDVTMHFMFIQLQCVHAQKVLGSEYLFDKSQERGNQVENNQVENNWLENR